MQTHNRLGTFFVLIGLVLLILYFGSVITRDSRPGYLLVAIVLLFAGILLQQYKRTTNDSGRFSAIRRASAMSRQRREEQRKNKQPKK
ncbi:MAG TPA: hypothetical protein VMT91_12640 [Anaerolineales bacterium]|nr:hypothetical protein [Anaerolineales bacterium]